MNALIEQPLHFAIILFVALLLASEIGFHLGRYRRTKGDAEASADDAGALTGIVYALLGLMIAFTFSTATTRFDDHRELILKEANAIGTSYLRIDLLPAEFQPGLRTLYRDYTQNRIATYQSIGVDIHRAKALHDLGLEMQQKIWRTTVAATLASQSTSTQTLVINALNDMIDVANERLAALRKLPPNIIFIMLFVLSAIASALAGYKLAEKPKLPRVQVIVFALALAGTMYVVNDLGHPRVGLFTIEATDKLLEETLEGMRGQ
jgi:hypothetical protein